MKDIKNIQKLYQGCISTPSLWPANAIFNLEQLEVNTLVKTFDAVVLQNLRLGKLVERFICYQLQQEDSIKLLVENVQIQHHKLTLGELDCILEKDNIPIHLEIIYKFYLYDATVGSTEIDHWIGPNRNDTFVKKLNKLKDRQLPLLYSAHTKSYLDNLSLEVKTIQQKVCFKAQLFVPLTMKNQDFELVNNDCVQGIYIKRNQLHLFQDCKFFIPEKLDWLLEVHPQVDWKTYGIILENLNELLDHKKSPMLWIKNPNGTIEKCFVVWW